VDELRRPAAVVSTGVALHAIGLDREADRIYAHGVREPLVVFDFDGRKRPDLNLTNAGIAPGPLQFVPHTDGQRLLIRFPASLCVVAFKTDKGPLVRVDPNFPAPVEVKDAEPAAAAPVKRGDMTYRELKLTVAEGGGIDPCWDAAGDALFHLESDGTLTRLSGRDFFPERRLPLGKVPAAMALSAQGLLVALRDQPDVLVINPETLQVVRKITCPTPARYLASHAKLSTAVAVGTEVTLLDVKEGKVLTRGLQGPDAELAFQGPEITPDGKCLFLAHAAAGSSKVLRVRIEPARLVVEESRVTDVRGLHAFCVTADGKHVAWYAPNVKGKKQETAFYPVGDWKAPAFTLPVRARAMAAGDDGALYVHAMEGETLRFAEPANKEAKASPLHWSEGRIRDLAPRPQHAGAFVASTGQRMYYGAKK
jgi:hypothetical protein